MPIQSTQTGAAHIDGLIWGWHWNQTNWAFSFPTSAAHYINNFGYDQIVGFQPFNAGQQAQIVQAVSALQTFLPVSFFNPNPQVIFQFAQASQIDYGSTGFQTQLHGPGGGGSAEAAVPDPNYQNPQAAGDTWYIPGAYVNPLPGSFANAAGLLHEFGHALGLKHGHASQPILNQFGQTVGTAAALPSQFDDQNYTIMTYRVYQNDDPTNFNEPEDLPSPQVDYPSSFMMLDIAALQHLYGANFGTNSNPGNTTYSFNTDGSMNVNENGTTTMTPATLRNKIFTTIWDGGGYDVFDFRNHNSSDMVIDLGPGSWMRFSDSQLAQLGQHTFAYGNVGTALQYNNDPRSLFEAVFTGNKNDTVTGNIRDNYINTGAGNDTIDGKTGADTMVGGNGNDTYTVDNANDSISELPGEGFDTVKVSSNYTMAAEIEQLDMLGTGDLQVNGNASANIINGNSGNNTINGAAGTDLMTGMGGNDTYAVDNSLDQVVEQAAGGTDAIYSSVDLQLAGNVETLILTGSAVQGFGDATANQIFGNNLVNVLFGQGGNDYLLGLGGDDIFVITPEAGAFDVIGDFQGASVAGGDRIGIAGFGAGAAVYQVSTTSFEIRSADNSIVQQFVLQGHAGTALDAGDFYFA